jgi:hypothetical protein
MRRVSWIAVAVFGLGGCAVEPPPGPSFMALPSKGKSYAVFSQQDAYCRQQAYIAAGGRTAGQAGANSELASAGLGTVAGAAAGALLGAATGNAGAGAAIGAGTGLAFGSVAGAGAANASEYDLQRRYDQTYGQCMVAYGNLVPVPQPVAAYPAYAYPPVAVGVGVGF